MTEINTQQFLPAYEDMVKAGMHFGRKKTIFHPNMKPYVYTLKDNIYILDLIKTTDTLIKAIDFLKKAIADGKMILFVGLTKQSTETTKATAEALGMPYVVNRWLGGTLTNFKTIIGRVKFLEDLEIGKASLIVSTIPEKETNQLILKVIKRGKSKSVAILTARQIEDAIELYHSGADYVILPHFLGGEYTSKLIETAKDNKNVYEKEKVNELKILKERLKDKTKEDKISCELESTNEYVKKFAKITPAKGKKLLSELKKIEGVPEELAIKITDMLPDNDAELLLLIPRNINIDEATKTQILDLVKKNQ